MKFPHNGALALIGWYLMMPPSSHTLRTLHTANLSTWKIEATYASASECEQARQTSTSHGRPNLRNAKQQYLAHRGECIASDDPRLKSQ